VTGSAQIANGVTSASFNSLAIGLVIDRQPKIRHLLSHNNSSW
jgi:hypothetical protein